MLSAVVEHAIANWDRSCGYVATLGAPRGEAEDIVQNAVTTCCAAQDRPVKEISGFWRTCLRNALRSYRRRQVGCGADRHTPTHEAMIVSSETVAYALARQPSRYGRPEEEAIAAELAHRIEAVLTPWERAGLARHMSGKPSGADRKALMHARARIRKLLACS